MHKTPQVVRASGLRPGARQALAAERLHADDRADHVAVDVDVAGANPRAHGFDGFVDACLDAVRQSVTGGVDRRDQRRELSLAIAQNVEHRPEHFAFELADALDFDQCRREETAARAVRGKRKLEHRCAGRRRRAGAPSCRRSSRSGGPGARGRRTARPRAPRDRSSGASPRTSRGPTCSPAAGRDRRHSRSGSSGPGAIERGADGVGDDLLG